MDFLIKFAQTLESFRQAEIEALAVVEGVDLTIVHYCRQSIHELWGSGTTLADLHRSVTERTSHQWPQFKTPSFKFALDSYQGARSAEKWLSIIESFDYLPFDGPIRMANPDQVFTVFELWEPESVPLGLENPEKMYLGRFIAASSRDTILKYDLKKRRYISTTSLDAELSLVTANMALAAPGKLFYDPFVGTGSLPIACAHFGATTWGSDIDGRSFRGDGDEKTLRGNFNQYCLVPRLGDVFSADLTNSPLRRARLWDGIICDPPYGVREGLKVLGVRDPEKTPWLIEQGMKHASLPDFVPSKKPYSFLAMLQDILAFAADTLVVHGRLSFWMPTANDEELEIPVPSHPCLELISVCVQVFNKWSRRLITYQRLPDESVSRSAYQAYRERQHVADTGTTADELNPFRRCYFRKFEAEE